MSAEHQPATDAMTETDFAAASARGGRDHRRLVEWDGADERRRDTCCQLSGSGPLAGEGRDRTPDKPGIPQSA